MKRIAAKAADWLADATGLRLLRYPLPHPKGPNVETLRVPGYYQTQRHTCGFVAGAIVLRYFRPDFTAERFYDRVRPHATRGTSRRRLKEALESCGVRVSWRRDLDFAAVVHAIDRLSPIATIVHTNDEAVKHWVVIYGYSTRPNRIFVAANWPPVVSPKTYAWSMFRQYVWEQPGFGLVCSGVKDD